MIAIAIALTLGALCGFAIVIALMLERRDQARITLAEQRQRQIAEWADTLDSVHAVAYAFGLAAADAVESFGRFVAEGERALRKRRV